MPNAIPTDYRPHVDEPYMNPRQLAHFHACLISRRRQLVALDRTCQDALRAHDMLPGDEADQANKVTEMTQALGGRIRTARELGAIDQALIRIALGDYGYCAETGEEIGLARLLFDPTATLTVAEQERRERGLYRAA